MVNFGDLGWFGWRTGIFLKKSNKQEVKGKLTTPVARPTKWLTSAPEVNHLITSKIRRLKGSQKTAEFARKCGIGESLLRQYLAGSMPGADKLAQIAKANGVSLDWFVIEGDVLAPGSQAAEPGRAYVPAVTATPLNHVLLSATLSGVEQALARAHLRPSAEKHAELVALVYEHCLPAGELQPGVIERFLKLIS